MGDVRQTRPSGVKLGALAQPGAILEAAERLLTAFPGAVNHGCGSVGKVTTDGERCTADEWVLSLLAEARASQGRTSMRHLGWRPSQEYTCKSSGAASRTDQPEGPT